MAKKKSFVLRINYQTYVKIERWAADEFRSANGQIEYIIQNALKIAGRDKTEPLINEENVDSTSA